MRFTNKTVANTTAKVVLPKPRTATTASKKCWRFSGVAAVALGAVLAAPPEDGDGGGAAPPARGGGVPPAPRDAALRAVVPPRDDGAAGPTAAARRLQGDGWTVFEGWRLPSYARSALELYDSEYGSPMHLSLQFCKDACLSREECMSIDFLDYGDGMGSECHLSEYAAQEDGDGVHFYTFDDMRAELEFCTMTTELGITSNHYVAPPRNTIEGMARQELQAVAAATAAQLASANQEPDVTQELAAANRVRAFQAECALNHVHLHGPCCFGDDPDSFLPYCDVSPRTDFSWMFSGSSSNADISRWDVSAGRDFASMFAYDSAFDADISGWEVSKGTDFTDMFREASEFHRDLSGWMIGCNAAEGGVSGMFTGAEKMEFSQCPCICDDRAGTWLRFCPGKEDLGRDFCDGPNEAGN